MSKKVILGTILGLGLAFCGLNSHLVSAIPAEWARTSDVASDEHNYVEGEVVHYTDDNCAIEGDIGIPCPTECFDDDNNFQEGCRYDRETNTYIIDDATYEDIIHEGTSGEPEVICASTDEPGCEDIEDGSEPALWPMIVSLSAIGAAFILIMIINLSHRKK